MTIILLNMVKRIYSNRLRHGRNSLASFDGKVFFTIDPNSIGKTVLDYLVCTQKVTLRTNQLTLTLVNCNHSIWVMMEKV